MVGDAVNSVCVVVRRPGRVPTSADASPEYLLLHRMGRGEGWGPVTGVRRPDEPLLTKAMEEVAAVTGVGGAEPLPVDLSGPQALFTLEVPADTVIKPGQGYDGMDWTSAQQALLRCGSEHRDALSKAVEVAPLRFTFRSMAREDIPDLIKWQRAPHVSRWWADPVDLEAAELKYGPRIDGKSPTRMHITLIDGRPAGFVQHHLVRDELAYSEAVGRRDGVAIHGAIGLREFTGRGTGPRFIWSMVRQVALAEHQEQRYVVATPHVENVPVLRALTKAGFLHMGVIKEDHDDFYENLCLFDRQRVYGH